MEPIIEIQDAIDRYANTLPTRAWVYEVDRWENLLFSIIRQYCDEDPDKAGTAVNILRDWNLIDIEELAAQDKIPLEFNSAYKKIMLGLNFSLDEIQENAKILVRVAQGVKKAYDGKIQMVLREYGELIRDELIRLFSDEALDNEKIEHGVTLWLQSAFGLPILSEKQSVKDYCDQRGINMEDLQTIADELDLNLGVLDYFIEKNVPPVDDLPPERKITYEIQIKPPRI